MALHCVKSPPKRPTLLTSQGTELYLCGRKGRPSPPAPPHGPLPLPSPLWEGVDSAAELDTPHPTKPANKREDRERVIQQKQICTEIFEILNRRI